MTTSDQPSSQANRGSKFWPAGCVAASAILWLVALVVPVWQTQSEHQGNLGVVSGALPAMIGFLGIFVWCPAWFANLLLIPMWKALLKRSRRGRWLTIAAFAIALTAYWMPALYGDNDRAVIVGRLIGFYLWLGSFAVILVGHTALCDRPDQAEVTKRWALVALAAVAVVVLELVCRVSVVNATTRPM